ncbi:MAG TPA: CHASE3 domain-containing protein [Afifellaceae bacterium]|nr:CHASE3 domain-containing protein [Afifellaceae bacterium]
MNKGEKPDAGSAARPSRLDHILSNRILIVLLTIGLALSILGIGLFAVRSHRASESVVNSSKIREVSEAFLGVLRNAEAAERGYLISEDTDYLSAFDRAVFQLNLKLSELSGLAWSTPREREVLSEIRSLTEQKIESLSTAIDLKKQGRDAEALNVFKADLTEEMSRKISLRTTDLMIDQSLRISSAREQADDANERFGIGVMVLMLCVAVLIIILFRRSRFEIEMLNERQAVLDELVAERTAELQAEKLRVEALLSDVSHRIGNSLAMVASSLSLQERAASNDDVKDALREAADRIRSVASAQRRLRLTGGQDSVEAETYFGQIVDDLRTTMPDDNVRFVTSIEPMDLPGDMALSFGVLFNELAINALRHAFDGLGNGTIAARLFRTDDSIIFQVEDDGRGIDWRNSEGAGIGTLVIDALVQSLGAEMYEADASQDDERKGTVFVIKKPLSGQQSAGDSAGV